MFMTKATNKYWFGENALLSLYVMLVVTFTPFIVYIMCTLCTLFKIVNVIIPALFSSVSNAFIKYIIYL